MYSKGLILLALVALVTPSPTSYNITKVPKQSPKRIYIHWMPWFENRQTNTNGQWGIHWTMANKNPDNIIGPDNKREIAAHYYPEIHPYGSADPATMDYQIQMMKMAGADGVLIDWPGTIGVNDLGKNHENCMAFINRLEGSGLQFGVVYEDRNLEHTGDQIGQAKRDMEFARDNFFNRGNYIRHNLNAPLLLTFGPIILQNPSQWNEVFSVLNPKPTFLTLWYESQDAGQNAQGEYAWIYSDFMDGLNHFYNNVNLPVKLGVAYPGFHDFYPDGGWGPSYFFIPHEGTQTFRNTLNLALGAQSVQMIQIATWNDYGEGTMIEPTREFGNGFLNILAEALKLEVGDKEFNLVKELYFRRKDAESRNDVEELLQLERVNEALNDVQYKRAAELLAAI